MFFGGGGDLFGWPGVQCGRRCMRRHRGIKDPDQDFVGARMEFPGEIEGEGRVPAFMLAQPFAVDPGFGKIIDCAKMNQLPSGWLGLRQDNLDSIPADTGVVAKVVKLGVPGEARPVGTPVRVAVDRDRGELCLGIGRKLPRLIDDPSLCMDA